MAIVAGARGSSVRRSLLGRILGRLRERKDPPGPRLVATPFNEPRGKGAAPIIVVGCQRSGTSLLRRILDSHSHIACPPESKFILPSIQLLRDERSLAGLDSMGYSRLEVERSLAEFVRSFFDRYSETQGKMRWADKSPSNIECLAELWTLFKPDVRFVIIVRNGMDVAFSLADPHRHYPAINEHVALADGNVPVGAGRFWAEQNEKIEVLRSTRPEACFRLRYEELTTNPLGVLPPMFEFLHEPWEPTVIDYTRFPHHAGFEDPDVRRRNRIESNSDRHKAWPRDVQRAVRLACGPQLQKLGYE